MKQDQPAEQEPHTEDTFARSILNTYPRVQASADFDAKVMATLLARRPLAQRPLSFFDRLDAFFARPLYKLVGTACMGLFFSALLLAVTLPKGGPEAPTISPQQGAPLTAEVPDTELRGLYALNRRRYLEANEDAVFLDRRKKTPAHAPQRASRNNKGGSSWDANISALPSSSSSGSLC